MTSDLPHRLLSPAVRTLRHGLTTASVFALLAFSACGQSAPTASASAGEKDAVETTGHVRRIDGIDVFFVRGTARERGFAEGYHFAESIHEVFREYVIKKLMQGQGVPWNFMVRPTVKSRVTFPDYLVEWCEGAVEGMEAKDPDLLRVPELARDIDHLDFLGLATLPDFMGLACSSFAIWGDAVEGGGPLVGRNLDYSSSPSLLGATTVFAHAPDEDRPGFVSVGWPGFAGIVTGFSEHGVTTAIHDVYRSAKKGTKVRPRTVALWELLTSARPGANIAEQATAFMQDQTFGMGGNAMFAWRGLGADKAGPGAVVFEIEPEGATARMPGEDPFIACSNHFRQRKEPGDCWRYQALFDGVENVGPDGKISFDAGYELLQESKIGMTLYQTVANLATGELRVAVRRAEGEDGHFDVAEKLSITELIQEAAAGAPAAAQGR